ncbi:MAG: TonB-dependent receptor [Candidatus Eisenbacteria bacterium]|nr:TonB-dependent receptor [Candidatus Eisenbacteria bacterium]
MTFRAFAVRLSLRAIALFVALSWAVRVSGESPQQEEAGGNLDTLDADKVLSPFPVIGERIGRSAGPGRVRIDGPAFEARDAMSAEEIGPLLPSTKVNFNSRGEALFMIRGASERHAGVFLDGIPLVIPWDERADLSMIPLEAIAGARATRGVESALDGPNILAGSVRLEPFELTRTGYRTRLSVRAGEAGALSVQGSHAARQGPWHGLLAVARRERAAFLVPAGYDPPYHQNETRARMNSDLEQLSGLLRGGLDLPGGGRVRLLLLASDGSKGVPPETHTEDARFWREPLVRRLSIGASAMLPFGRSREWTIEASGSSDFLRQEIRSFDDASYTTPALALGTSYETGRNRSEQGAARLLRRKEDGISFALQGMFRRARREETLEVDGPVDRYAQNLGSAAGEIAVPRGMWSLRIGGGYEAASTPETGDKPARGTSEAPVLHARLERTIGGKALLYASASRRSRFPSLRELFSGALGRFVPNPDLGPERQDLWESGFSSRGDRFDATLAFFESRLQDGIERVVLPGGEGLFQRVNVTEIRARGAEAVLTLRPFAGAALSADHLILHVRSKEDGVFRAPVEDRPDYLSTIAFSIDRASGLGFSLETIAVGPRWSADAADAIDGRTRLGANARWNLRASYRRFRTPPSRGDAEIFLRVDNLFDRRVEAEVGLPEAGRILSGGIKLGFG